jgi:hypothetical protein
MKKQSFKVLLIAAVISFSLFSCNSSEKGKWSDSDKERFRKDMNDVKGLDSFGDKKTKFIECYLTKCEANFSSYYQADQDEAGCEKIAMECATELQ